MWSKLDIVGMTWRGKRVDSYLVVPGTLVSPLAPDTVRLMEENDLPGNISNPHWKWMGAREVGVVLDHVCRETSFKRLDVYVKILLSGSRVRWVGEWNMKRVSAPPRVVREIGSHKHFRGF